MPEQEETSPTQTETGRGGTNPSRNQQNSDDRGRGNQSNRPKGGRFKGKCKDLEGIVCDTGLPNSQQDLFSRTTQEIAECAAREFKDGGDIRTTLTKQAFPKFKKPDPIKMLRDGDGKSTSTADPADLERHKLEAKTSHDEETALKRNLKRVFALILGQCSPTIRDRMEASPDWEAIDRDSDTLELLKLIQKSLCNQATTKKELHAQTEAETAFHRFTQGRHMTNSDYLDKFKGLTEVWKHLGGKPGVNDANIAAVKAAAVKTGTSSSMTVEQAEKAAEESHLAMFLLTKSDRRRCGSLVADSSNDCMRGVDGHPTTLSKACDVLVNCKPLHQPERFQPQDTGLAFAQFGGRGGAGGRGDHGGRGGGRGGRGGGRGSGASDGGHRDATDNNQVESDNDNTSQGYLMCPAEDVRDAECFLQKSSRCLPALWLLLDSCSNADIFSNPELLHNMHTARRPMRVHCNAGTVTLHEQGHFGDYPHPVWCNPQGIANILSMDNVGKTCRLTMDTAVDAGVAMHGSNGKTVAFEPARKGLRHHHLTTREPQDNWSMIQTVDKLAGECTRRTVEAAKTARRFQNIIMRPSSRETKEIATKYVTDCPITSEAVDAADRVFGPNLGSLKGKTVRTKRDHVSHDIGGVPRPILDKHRNIAFAVDIVFVNKIPFLVTRSRVTKFGTIEALPNRQVPTIRDKLRSVCTLHKKRGFRVNATHADDEFEPLRPDFPVTNTCGADDHVPEIERCIRLLKDRIRSGRRMLPFARVPRITLIHLAKNAVFWLNSFPVKDGASEEFSPRCIMTGQSISCTRHVRLEFGECAQTHEEHDNSMTERTMGAICLGPTGNSQGSHWFMSLVAGAKIVRTKWTNMPMPREVIQRVNQLGRAQNMPRSLTFADRHGHEIKDTLSETAENDQDDDNSACTCQSEEDDSLDEWVNDSTDEESDGDESDDDSDNESDDSGFDDPGDDDDDNNGNNELSDDDSDDENSMEGADSIENAGVEDEMKNAGVRDQESAKNTGVEESHDRMKVETVEEEDALSIDDEDEEWEATESEEFDKAKKDGERAAEHDTELPKRTRRAKRDSACECAYDMLSEMDFHVLTTMMVEEDDPNELMCLLTEQMNAKKGLKLFGSQGEQAIMDELEQPLCRKAIRRSVSGRAAKEPKTSSAETFDVSQGKAMR